MKILNTCTVTCEYVDTSDEDFPTYIRYSADNWFNWMGESHEPVFNQGAINQLEKAYQEYKNVDKTV